MENSNIKAEIVYYMENPNLNVSNVDNISQLSKYLQKTDIRKDGWLFGDLVLFDDYRATGTYIIGKEGKLVGNPDNSLSGYLTIPYEITQYLDNAVEKYLDIFDLNDIELRFDDKFIRDNINTSNCKILEKWGWKISYCTTGELHIEFPNNKFNTFDVENISAYKIKNWYEASQKEQVKFRLYYKLQTNDEMQRFQKKHKENKLPKLPSTWTRYLQGAGGGCDYNFEEYIYMGPKDDKDKMIKCINKFYDEIYHTIDFLT